MEKLTIKIDYDKHKGLSMSEFTQYLVGVNNEYAKYTNKKSELSIQNIDKGSIIFEFTQTIIMPTLMGIVDYGVYEFGNYLIKTLIYAVNTNINELIDGFNKKEQRTINYLNTLKNITNNYGTINFINITTSNGTQDQSYNVNKDTMKDISDNILPLLDSPMKNDNGKDIEYYESMELQLKTTSTGQEKVYKGIIKDIDKKIKKVVFINSDIKNQFCLEDTFFEEKPYIVSVNVYFNPNKSVRKYEIVEYLGLSE